MPIVHPSLYMAVYARMQTALAHVLARSTHGRTKVYRSGNAVDAGRMGADKYRTPYKSSTNDGYRWTGPRPPGVVNLKPAAGGVYTSIGLNDALLGEFAFYAFGTTLDEDVQRRLDGKSTMLTSATFPATLAAKRIFEYEFSGALRIADLSLTGTGGRRLLRLLDHDAGVKAALKTATFANAEAAYVASHDNSLPRAMSQAVRDMLPGYDAVWVTSARADSAREMRDIEGDNIVFYGPDGMVISALRPVREISFTMLPNGKYKDVINTL